jgi:hypothetical protein
MATEGARIAAVIRENKSCRAAEALAKARALYGNGAHCKGGCEPQVIQLGGDAREVPQESSRLDAKMATCSRIGYISPFECVPESIRIARVERQTQEEYARLGPYVRVFPAPCPPDPEWYKNAGEPILQGRNCPLPNKPYNPVLPG